MLAQIIWLGRPIGENYLPGGSYMPEASSINFRRSVEGIAGWAVSRSRLISSSRRWRHGKPSISIFEGATSGGGLAALTTRRTGLRPVLLAQRQSGQSHPRSA